jgi:hypothetical protein
MADRKQGMDILLSEREYVPTIIQTQLLNDIAGILYEQLAVMKDSIPDLVKKYEFDVTDSLLELNPDVMPSLPWIAMTLFNDGADPIHLYVNEYGENDGLYYLTQIPRDPTLDSGDSIQIDMRAPKIKKVFIKCDTGNTATVRIISTMKEYGTKQREDVKL